jgi:hypothetical protein
MKFWKSLSLACLTLAPLASQADTFILKDGTRLEGRILHEKDGFYLLEVNVSPSIKDERTVAKADIEKIERTRPDEIAFRKVEGLAPAPDLLTADQYDARILALEEFLKEHPYGTRTDQAKEMLSALKTEATAVYTGGIKLGGKIIPAEEYRANAYELDAQIAAAKIRRLAESTDLLGCLRAFAEFEKDFRNTRAADDLVPLIRKVIVAYRDQTSEWLATLEKRTEARLKGLERMSLEDRTNSERAIQEEAAYLESRYQSEKAARAVWFTAHPFHKASIEENTRTAERELRRLETQASRPHVDGGKAFRDAWAVIQDGDEKSIRETLSKVRSARLPDRYVQILEDAARESKP